MKRMPVFWVVGLLVCTGCSPFSVAKRGLKELRGASGDVVPIRECSPDFYASIGAIRMGSVTNSIAPVCPPDMFARIEASLAGCAADASEALAGSGAAVLDVDISFNKRPGGVLAVAGKEGLLIGRAAVKDDAGRQQGDLLVGVSSEAMRTTNQEMADVFGKVLIGHIIGKAEK